MPFNTSILWENILLPSTYDGGQWSYLLEEKNDKGKMLLTVNVPAECLRTDTPPNKHIFFLKRTANSGGQNTADGVIWEKIDEHSYKLHIFELKTTIDSQLKNWEKAKSQFHGTYIRCRIIAFLADVEIFSDVNLYTVYHQLQDAVGDDVDPLLDDVPTDIPDNAISPKKAWEQDKCDITFLGWNNRFGQAIFNHSKIHLDNINPEGIPAGNFQLVPHTNNN